MKFDHIMVVKYERFMRVCRWTSSSQPHVLCCEWTVITVMMVSKWGLVKIRTVTKLDICAKCTILTGLQGHSRKQKVKNEEKWEGTNMIIVQTEDITYPVIFSDSLCHS